VLIKLTTDKTVSQAAAVTPALSSFGEERENYFVGRLTQGVARGLALPWAIIFRPVSPVNQRSPPVLGHSRGRSASVGG
jgi:hypothetical protein